MAELSRKRNASEAELESGAAPAAPNSATVAEWQPAAGESPAEREKRMKKEKRAARLGGGAATFDTHQAPPSYIAPPSASSVGEWQPAAGESPADREKRIKREKRAARLGHGTVTFDTNPAPPSGSSYVPPPPAAAYPSSYSTPGADEYDGSSAPTEPGVGMAIHPSRMGAAPALAQEGKKKKPQAQTPARLRYLKAKKDRAKGRKAGMPNAPKEGKLSKKAKAKLAEIERRQAAGEPLSESESSSEEEDKEEAEQKRQEILKKKEERKIKREAKKAEIRRLKAEGGEIPAPTPRVVSRPAAPKPTPIAAAPAPAPAPTPIEVDADTTTPAEPDAAEIEAAEEEAARLARKEAKRLKREKRRLAPEPEEESTLIPTDTVERPPHLPSRSPTPVVDIEPITKEEPAPLLRLPGAMRPAAPSKKTLSDLNVHESVRNKRVVDPEMKLKIEGEELGVSEKGRKRLAEMGITEAFAVQTAVLPLLLPPGSPTYLYSAFAPPQDLCVSAPTGSGKTLSYVVPIVETLAPRVVTRLRALILLPTRDLVAQVRETFEQFGKGTGLKVGTATGQHSFAHEQVSLVSESVDESIEGGSSQIDILIATPGRLMDHIRATPGFSLQHLRYLVVDEADRLLTQSFHDWLPSILAALKPSSATDVLAERNGSVVDALAPEWWDAKIGRVASDMDVRSQPSCQKLLFSATLSRDPAKINALHLHRPIYISVEDALDPHAEDEGVDSELKFTFPAQLKEHMIFSPSTHKPLYLFHLLHTLSLSSALCFTKSVEAATRLAKLVEFFEQARADAAKDGEEVKKVVVKAYSSELPSGERTRILASFKKGEIQMLICSDLIARGIDLPHVSHVISYDIPADMRKYVHRVGRTARAGKSGDAWSLVEDQEAAPFKAIMTSAQHLQKIARVRVKDSLVEPFMPAYQTALEKLRAHFATGQAKNDATA